ncbi:putative NADPH-dependent methylglyoxal reductase Grp2p [[Candida] railenensis]|uniref:NADPH-dependent methylglyoxal reductase Grp2p n=1 Tax=[Candida] railenensis TaxID=45579 RepID=A0A9P0VZI3_9ASCO|nr:putative NADPH-dependent methylglyoxal reductase Grp2p [[Candida] railenensis]
MGNSSVFVSGATGFIAQHVIKQLIEKGYKVVGSVRTEAKGQNIQKNFGSENFKYEIVEDLETVGAFDKALKNHPEVTIFMHTASPVTWSVQDNEKDIILPAINGTVNALKAINATSPQIEKVIITSSIVTQFSFSNRSALTNENSWNDITYDQAKETGSAAYHGSKTFAEKAAVEFVEKEKPSFSVSTVHPVFVFGPQVFDSEAKGQLNVTNTFISDLLNLKKGQSDETPVPKIMGSFVDVRDVAKAHLIEIEKPTNGLRVIAQCEDFNSQKLLNIINDNFPALNLVKGDPSSTSISDRNVDDSKSREYLGLQYISLEASVVDTVQQYVTVNKLL